MVGTFSLFYSLCPLCLLYRKPIQPPTQTHTYTHIHLIILQMENLKPKFFFFAFVLVCLSFVPLFVFCCVIGFICLFSYWFFHCTVCFRNALSYCAINKFENKVLDVQTVFLRFGHCAEPIFVFIHCIPILTYTRASSDLL